jgi:SH3-like domain-containing protein
MRFPARLLLLIAPFLLCGGASVEAQNVPAGGTLKVPSHPGPEQPMKPPTAAPREPVHRLGSSSAGKPPVVAPHGPVHPHKPAGMTPPGKTVKTPPVAPAVVPAPPAAETKTEQPEKLPDPEKAEGTASKLPRFASLRSDDVNMRVGPGMRYRIDWVYKRRDLPVEIEREFDVWRWVRDADGIQGWVQQATLMGRRSFIVQKSDATLRAEASDSAAAVAVLKPGVIGRIRSCDAASDWCDLQTGSYRGYLRREQFWGVLPDEAISP